MKISTEDFSILKKFFAKLAWKFEDERRLDVPVTRQEYEALKQMWECHASSSKNQT